MLEVVVFLEALGALQYSAQFQQLAVAVVVETHHKMVQLEVLAVVVVFRTAGLEQLQEEPEQLIKATQVAMVKDWL